MIRKVLFLIAVLVLASACVTLMPDVDGTATPDVSDIATQTAAAMPTATLPEATPSPPHSP